MARIKEDEYPVEKVSENRKRICLTIDLKDDQGKIKKYLELHEPKNIWPEIPRGIIDSGIKVMDIYHIDNRLFMICEVEYGYEFNDCFNVVSSLEKQEEWAQLMRTFQKGIPARKQEWIQMKRVFSLTDNII